MEHPCYKCGANVEDGTAFCPHCNAPQIRVGTESSAQSGDLSLPYPPMASAPAAAIQWPQALASAAIAGVVAAVLMLVPLGAFGLGMLVAGILSVLLYRRKNPGGNITPGVGARLGALTGMLGFGMFAVFTAVASLIGAGGELRADLLEAVEKSATRSSDPQFQQMIEYLKSPPGLLLAMAAGLVVMLFVSLIFSTLGGTIAGAFSRSRHRL